ncbi:hypothetical protein CROQUDRAFT_102179 [Cronartium quercuum f. sp. fusiforme G11]|uniref:Uncharacterized protein n=1 Tax=Cronartium quercuum f. sp. fusiforme G11 TaxID=708437 RepID=A0A9P6T4V8_9BASI|nr:hypothetical protein CROQUDRAFT_102179 [Cronartium quercuum f. sp. fusiforme G11]
MIAVRSQKIPALPFIPLALPVSSLRLRGTFDPLTTRLALASLPRPEVSAIAQLWANHSPLNTYLHRIKAEIQGLQTNPRPGTHPPQDPTNNTCHPNKPKSVPAPCQLHPHHPPIPPSLKPSALIK